MARNSRWVWVSEGAIAWLVLAAGGCAVGPDYHAPKPPASPKAWHATEVQPEPVPEGTPAPAATRVDAGTPTMELARWWKEFDDPLLDSLVTRALTDNPDLRVATARVMEARALRGAARGPLYPSLDGTGSATRSRGSETISKFGGFNTEDQSQFGIGLDSSWEIDLWGAVRRGVEAAEAELGAAEEARRDAMVTLIAEVARNYTDARGFQRRLEVARGAVKIQEETVKVAETRFKAGIAGELDVAQARAQLETRRSQIPLLKTAYWQAVHRLSVLIGKEPAALAGELEAPGSIPPPPPIVTVGVPTEILARRPDVRRAERSLAAATARIGVATADLYPRFTLNGSFGFQSAQVGNLIDANSRVWSIGPAMRWNLFDGNRIRRQIDAAGAREQQALALFDAVVLGAFEEVENRLVQFNQEQYRRAALQRAVAANERAVALSNDLYAAQLRDFLYVLDSQRALYDSQDALVQSEVGVSTALIGLYKSLGGGWQDAMFTPAPPPGVKEGSPAEESAIDLEASSGGPGRKQ